MNESEEILDLVNANDTVIGYIRRSDMAKVAYRHPRGYVRFAEAFLVNNDGKIWVPTRNPHKAIAPSGLDFSVAEHVQSGETYADAIVRGFVEEAGLRVSEASLTLLGVMPPTKTKPVFNAVYVYFGYGGEDPRYSKEEFPSAEWLSPEELKKVLGSGRPTKDTLPPALRMLTQYRLT